MAGTVKVTNISSKATIKEIEEFFSFSGQIESVNLNSDGAESQTAYVTFMDQDSVKIALLLSGSAILDKEVTISPCSNSSAQAASEPATDPLKEQGGGISTQSRPRAINRAQEIVRSMLSKGFSLGKDVMRRADSLDEKNKDANDGDVLKDLSISSLDRRKSHEYKVGDDAHTAQELVSNSGEDNDKARASDDVNEDDTSAATGEKGENAANGGSQQNFQGDGQAKAGSNNVRMSMQKCYKHVCAINEKLQLGQRTLSALATAQQGVAHAGSAVANNKFVSAGGGWMSGALSRVSLRNANNTSPHLNHDGGEGSPSQQNEHVQLTEMTTFSGHKSEDVHE